MIPLMSIHKLNIVIPMAGLGSRFTSYGFSNIKPLIQLNGKTFIEWSIDSVDFKNIDTQFIFVILEEHRSLLENHLKTIKPNCIIESVPNLTRGATETALAASRYIALVGIHYWKKGSYFVNSGLELINRNIRSNNEYYISITYNLLIEKNLKVTCYKLGDYEKYLSIGTPEQVFDYLNYKNLNVKIFKLENFTNGWFIGDFDPSLLKNTGVELAVMNKKKGRGINDFHYHQHCTEINVLIKGKISINDLIINENEIFVFDPNVPSVYEYLEDCTFVVFKNKPSNNDKVIM